MSTFQATGAPRVAAVRTHATPPTVPLEGWAMAASRFGLQPVRRRRITVGGV